MRLATKLRGAAKRHQDGDRESGSSAAVADRSETRPAPPSGLMRRWITPLIAGAAVAGLATTLVLSRSGGGASVGGTAKAVPTVAFRDVEAGFTIEYPSTWTKVAEAQGDRRLLLNIDGQNSLLVRSFPLFEKAVTPDNLSDVKAVTDAIVVTPDVTVLKQQMISLRDMPAIYYLYRFRDAGTGLDGVHAHYFVFRGRRAVSMVFQAVPAEDFSRLAPDFDRVAESLKIAPAPDAAPATSS